MRFNQCIKISTTVSAHKSYRLFEMNKILAIASICLACSVNCESFEDCGDVKNNVEDFNETAAIKHGDFPW